MPGGDRTGPYDGGSRKGMRNIRWSQQGAGVEGNCICPSCGKKIDCPYCRIVIDLYAADPEDLGNLNGAMFVNKLEILGELEKSYQEDLPAPGKNFRF